MKRIFFIFFLIFNFSLLATSYKDGVYYVIAEKDTYGWKPFTELIINKGKFTKVITDRINNKGELASKDVSYNKNMKKSSSTNPEEYSINIPNSFIKSKGTLDIMDSVAGVTDSFRQFKTMANFLLEKAIQGKSGKYTLDF